MLLYESIRDLIANTQTPMFLPISVGEANVYPITGITNSALLRKYDAPNDRDTKFIYYLNCAMIILASICNFTMKYQNLCGKNHNRKKSSDLDGFIRPHSTSFTRQRIAVVWRSTKC